MGRRANSSTTPAISRLPGRSSSSPLLPSCCSAWTARSVPTTRASTLFGAARVASGDVPHRDFYANYGPAQFYILAFLFEVFSPSVLVERAWDAAARSASVVLTFLIVARVASIAAAWLAALASLAWLAALGSHGYPVFPALAAALASLLCLMPAFAGAYSAPWLLAAGSCVGLVALFRYDVGFFVLVAEGLVLGACTLSRARQAGRGHRASLSGRPCRSAPAWGWSRCPSRQPTPPRACLTASSSTL